MSAAIAPELVAAPSPTSAPPPGGSGHRELLALLAGDWLASWRGLFPRHTLARQWLWISALSLLAATLMGGVSFCGFKALHTLLGPKTPSLGNWGTPFLTTIAYGWFFLCTIWLGRTYRRRERVVPLLLSPLPFPHLAAYMMLRDTGLVGLLVTLLGLPFLIGALLGVGADASALALAVPLWLTTLGAALAMANATILLLFRLLPAGWEGPLSFATANVLILLLPMLTKGLATLWVPFYWPGLLAAKVLQAAPGLPRIQAFGLLAAMAAGLGLMVYTLTRQCLHTNWSKSEEMVPSRFLGRLTFLSPGQSAMASLILKDWLLISRAWGEVLIVVILLGVTMRLRANMGLPMVEMTGAPLLSALLGSWALIELLAFLGESQREGPNTMLLALSPLGSKRMVWAKFVAIAMPRLLLGEVALLAASLKGALLPHHALMGQLGLGLMVATLTWLEVAHAFEGDPARLGRWLGLWERLFQFWRLFLIYPLVGLFSVLATQVAALAWDQHVTGLTGLCFGALGAMTCLAAMLCTLMIKRKLAI